MPRSTQHQSVNLDVASTLQLPPGPWSTVFDCLCEHFAAIDRTEWQDRFERGRVLDGTGLPIDIGTPYRVGLTVHYFREVRDEQPMPFEASIVHVDEHLIVVDKPHFLAVLPAGRFVEQTVLRRLIRELQNPDLVPLHRIDRGTSGLVMFSANPATRSRYQALFREQRIEKNYEALAPALPEQGFPLVRRSRIVRGEPFFRMQEVPGPPNSESSIEVIERLDGTWRYALKPVSGRTHQLRVHMAGLGAPILNDPYYPELGELVEDDYTRPLKLLARSLAFVDPLSGERRSFNSLLAL